MFNRRFSSASGEVIHFSRDDQKHFTLLPNERSSFSEDEKQDALDGEKKTHRRERERINIPFALDTAFGIAIRIGSQGGFLTWHAISCFSAGAPLDDRTERCRRACYCSLRLKRFSQMTCATWSHRSHRVSGTSIRAKGSVPSRARYPPAVSIKPRRELCTIRYLAGDVHEAESTLIHPGVMGVGSADDERRGVAPFNVCWENWRRYTRTKPMINVPSLFPYAR